MVKPEELVAAGSYLSIKEKLRDESVVDSISARHYRHPALGDRPVVRLTADNLAEGDDLTMEFLGFAPPEITGPVAKRQRQALGFPGWAIVNDPQHARYALELVKEFKHAVRRSKAKPGFGYDEFTEISKRLGKSVAHFLPSFWEQAGREFIALDNATYGSRAFGKAREAEKVHALKVDESLRQDAFLEFALAGAVSIKALTEYGKELLSTHDPKDAWKFFRELCVRRTLGGMPPWTSMAKDLQPLIKAAGLNPDQEVQSMILEIIDSPAISRAATGFWDGASKGVALLVKKDPHAAGVLLNMIPQTSNWRNEDIWPWLNHLETWGILSNAWNEGVQEEAAPHGGPAAWLTRLIHSVKRQPRQIIYDILESMADRLRKDNVPVDLYSKERWSHRVSADVDLIDLALELKIPMLEVPKEITFDLKQWGKPDEPLANLRNRPRDPVHLVSDHRFTQSLRNAVEIAAGESQFENAATGKVALREARRDWLRSIVQSLTNGGLPRIEASLLLLENKTRQAIFQEFPEVLEELKRAELLPAIARTVRGGLMDEYGWPALERVHESFVAANKSAPAIFGHFPYIILTDRLKAVVLRGEEIVHETELKLPKGHELKCLFYIDGDLLVFSGVNYQFSAFWNSEPQPCDPEYANFPSELFGVSVDVPGGGTFIGDQIVHHGQKGLNSLRANDMVVSDGTHWWLRSADYDSSSHMPFFTLHEVDPATGKKGRKSLPSFFEDFVQNDSQLELEYCSLLPLGASFPKTPLGKNGELIGYRVRRSPQENSRIEGIDGRAMETSNQAHFGYLLDQPGTADRLPVEGLRTYHSAIRFNFWDPTGSYEVATVNGGGDGYSRGQVTGVSAIYLHAFQVRDAAASKKLRAITDKQVQALIEAEQQDFVNFTNGTPISATAGSPASPKPRSALSAVTQKLSLRDEAAHSPLLNGAIRKLLGAEVHPRLLTGLRGIIIRAGQKVRQLAKLVNNRSEVPVAKPAVIDVAAVDAATIPFLETVKDGYRQAFDSIPHFSFIESVENAGKFFTGESATVRFPEDWHSLLRTLTKGVAQRLWLSYCTDPADQKWIPFAEIWSRLSYHRLPGSFRLFRSENRNQDLFAAEIAALAVDTEQTGQDPSDIEWAIPYIGKSSRFLIHSDYHGYKVLEYSPTGKFESIPGLTEVRESEVIIPPAVWSPEALLAFVELAKKNSINIPSVEFLKSLAADVKVSVAEVALVWFGLPGFDSYVSNFMPTQLREAVKLKTKECSAAKESLEQTNSNMLQALVRSVVSGDPADLWENPPAKVADRIRTAWAGAQPDRIPLSAEWVDKLSDPLPYGIDKHQFFQALQTPGTHPLFSAHGVWTFVRDQSSAELICPDPQHQFDEEILQAASISISLLAYGLPVADSARNKLPEVYHATMKALDNPGLLVLAGYRYGSGGVTAPKLMELMESVVGKRQTQDFLDMADDGTIVAVRDDYRMQVAFRPAKVKTPAQMERLANQLAALCGSDPSESASLTIIHRYLQLVRSGDFQAIVDRIENSPLPAGSYEANPLHSAPELVQQIAKKYKLSDDAATYYLQLIALADPTDKNLTVWNGWTTATIKTLGAELIDKKLVLEASRSRAGRKYFLPGGWEDLKAPHLPLETWKMPLFQLARDAYQRATPPLGRIVPLEPVHTLFAKAWQRIQDGDVPRYEEVK